VKKLSRLRAVAISLRKKAANLTSIAKTPTVKQ